MKYIPERRGTWSNFIQRMKDNNLEFGSLSLREKGVFSISYRQILSKGVII